MGPPKNPSYNAWLVLLLFGVLLFALFILHLPSP